MKSNQGRKFQRRRDFKNKSKEEENDQLICYECKKSDHIRSDCPQLKKNGFDKKKKKKQKAHVATWSDEESSSDREEHEVANLYLMAIDNDPKVNLNSSSFDFTFDELQEAYDELQEVYDELVEKYKESVLKNKKLIFDLKAQNDSLSKTNSEHEEEILALKYDLKYFQDENVDLNNLLSKVHDDHHKVVNELKASLNVVGKSSFEKGSSSKPNYVKRNFNDYKQRGSQKHPKAKRIRSVWVPKELVVSNNIHVISSWIPKGTKYLRANSYGPKMVWVPKIKN
ncbi:hypothetical protein HRI_000695200 [Hibiscus trionum]|uniref:CCHC-type domain-containing protein n=1 Tax=Hibiscus trionum TaxID=183268 RepID=A0A9W7H390_HIBTR|nr:hypothetical protein HRI_000695200 [Hibiscus trionum]